MKLIETNVVDGCVTDVDDTKGLRMVDIKTRNLSPDNVEIGATETLGAETRCMLGPTGADCLRKSRTDGMSGLKRVVMALIGFGLTLRNMDKT